MKTVTYKGKGEHSVRELELVCESCGEKFRPIDKWNFHCQNCQPCEPLEAN